MLFLMPCTSPSQSLEDNSNKTNSMQNNDSNAAQPIKKPKGWGERHTLALMAFLGFCLVYAMRFSLSIAIISMVKPKAEVIDSENNNTFSECIASSNVTKSLRNQTGEFDWDESTQGLVLGSFFWGYILTQLPGGFAATKIGGKWPLGIGLFISGIMALLTPIAARMNISMLIYVRIIQGIAQGVIFPSMQKMLAVWCPPNELSFLSAVAYSGCQFGSAISMVTSGYLIESAGGWPSVFYFNGGLTILWFFFWIYFVYNSPAQHPWIAVQERVYIQQSIGEKASDEFMPTPWKAILTSGPVWVIAFAEFFHTWGLYTLLMEMPTYFKNVLKFDIEENSWLSATPMILMGVVQNAVTYVADYCLAKRLFKTLTIRKTCHIIAEVGGGVSLIGASFMGCDRTGAVILLTLAMSVSGAVCGSYMPNQVELSCNHAGILMGITNTIGNLAGFSVALVAGAITQNGSTHENWKYVFFIAAGFYLISTFLYTMFATVEEQPWNRVKKLQTTRSDQDQVPLTTKLPSQDNDIDINLSPIDEVYVQPSMSFPGF